MSFVSPNSNRFSISAKGYDLEIVINADKNWFIILFFCFWLVGWAFGWITVAASLVSGLDSSLFLVAWLFMWTLGGLFAGSVIIWSLFGRQHVIADRKTLSLAWSAIVPIRTLNYDVKQIRNVRADVQKFSYFFRTSIPNPFSTRYGSVAFDYGTRTVRFGINLDDAEAEAIVDTIREHMKRWT
ncbi:MAG: hypothetical protein KDJ77_19845 [Rhodobiaceae bacterium]|nr:hypothetical protein [Rhodobiaceae bacterium]